MVRWLHKTGPHSVGIREIQRHFLQMLEDGRHIFDAASNCLLGGGDPSVVTEDLYATDKRINLTEQKIRREIVVHGSIHGAASFPSALVMMSLVKDAERIGDYAKNIFDLARLKPFLGSPQERAALVELKDRVSKALVRCRGLFETQEEDAARAYLDEVDDLQKHCEAEVTRLIGIEGENAAGRVLALRHFKRTLGHAGNVITSIVMPVDKLDFKPGRPHSEQ